MGIRRPIRVPRSGAARKISPTIPPLIAVALLAAAVASGCAAHTSLEPVGKGRLALNASLGGPIAEVSKTDIPLPYLTAGADYGLSDELNLNGSLHLLSLAYGIVAVDAGVAWFPLRNDGLQPTLGVEPRILALASVKSGVEERVRFYPAVSLTGAWELGPGDIYAGADLALRLGAMTYDPEASGAIFSPFIGYRWDLGADYALLTELKWQGANVETHQLAITYARVGRYGALAPLVAIVRRF